MSTITKAQEKIIEYDIHELDDGEFLTLFYKIVFALYDGEYKVENFY